MKSQRRRHVKIHFGKENRAICTKVISVTVARRYYANNCHLGNGPKVIGETNINFG